MKIKIGMAMIALMFAFNLVSAAISDGSCSMMSGLTGGYGSGMMFLGWITYILVIALIVAGIYWLVKSANRKK